MNHANRSKKSHGDESNPRAEELVAFREKYNLTQTEAAKLAMSTMRTWQLWETGERRMHPAIWAWVQYVANPKDAGVEAQLADYRSGLFDAEARLKPK